MAHDNQVSSELYEEFDYSTTLIPNLSKENVISNFLFNIPRAPKTDEDGDLILCRKSDNRYKHEIKIEHSKRTALNLVGLQIWRGALLLADWIIYHQDSLTSLESNFVLELGSGVGLTSIVASMFTPVICTDIDVGGLLSLIRNNVQINRQLSAHPINVLELDFTKDFSREIEISLSKVRIVLAADVVYDNDLTEAFVATVQKLINIPPRKTIYVALEKRFVFTVADCDTCAPCYEYFKECLQKLSNATCELVPLDFPQYFQYDRVKELVLWKILSIK